jgi:hypothetical protein
MIDLQALKKWSCGLELERALLISAQPQKAAGSTEERHTLLKRVSEFGPLIRGTLEVKKRFFERARGFRKVSMGGSTRGAAAIS